MTGNMSVAIWFAQGALQLSIWAAGKTSKWKDFFKWILVLKIAHELGSECNRDIAIHFTAETGAAVEVSSLKCECSEQSLHSVFSVTYEAI